VSMSRHHADWLSLTEVSGPFLSLPTLARAFPQGLDAHDPERMALLRVALAEWEQNRDSAKPDPAIHRAWVRFVLSRILDLPDEVIAEGQAIPSSMAVTIPEHHETLRPDLLVVNPSREGGDTTPRLLIDIVGASQSLSDPPPDDAWQMARAERMATLLAATGVRLGLVTNGEQWMLVNATRDETPGYASWYATLWLDEPITLQAFRSLLGVGRFFGVADEDTLEALLTESAADQQEVTDQLGYQVRQAVEILIQTIDRIDKDRERTLLRGVDEKRLYESALTVMMRLVFLFSGEERDMLKLGEDLYDDSYAVSTLRAQLRETADRDGEEVLERRYDAWSRLLATFRVVYGGVQHDQLSLPAYGGTLFDPDRFPFLEGRQRDTRWEDTPADPIPINNRAVLHLLEALQVLRMKASGGATEARTLSFRALDVEQIGHVYEGLLDHTAVRASDPILGLVGGKDRVCEAPLPTLERLRQGDLSSLVAYLKEQTGRSEKALAKALEPQMFVDEQRLRASCDNDEDLFERVRPFAALLRFDTMEYPVVVTAGSVYVTQGNDRRSTGTHYTPRSLTEPIVRHTLEPVVYVGPAEGKPREEWRLRPPNDLLALKVCDMTMGSGAFLVQACRYLASLLVEAWDTKERQNPGRVTISPEGDLSTGASDERPLPRDVNERLILAQRLVADRCLYGVDINEMAVEMAKLSLWLITLQKNRPFTFLDHAFRHGDALLGVDLEQLRTWSLARDRTSQQARQIAWFEGLIGKALDVAIDRRRKIEHISDIDIRDVEEKERLLQEATDAIELARLGGDLLVATGLARQADQERLVEDLLYRYQLAVMKADEMRGVLFSDSAVADARAAVNDLRREADSLLSGRRPFHWPLEFPEVFVQGSVQDNPIGFDAIIGNPPFVGGQRITGSLGTDYRDYLVKYVAKEKRGSSDLCAYFFLRAGRLLRHGCFGLLATNTIAQGDTREVGLDQLVAAGSTIIRAVRSRKWPGAASLEVAHVWVRRGGWRGAYVLDDMPVTGITPFLTLPGAVVGAPKRLVANAGKSFQGSNVLGMGFVLTPEEAQGLIDKDSDNRNVLFPYLNGEDLNSRPDQSPSRWVINFHDWPLEQAETYPDCMRIVRERVKPERDRLASGDATARDRARRWWQFARPTMNLYATIMGLERVLVTAEVSKHINLTFQPTVDVFSHMLVVFPLDSWASFGCLQSTLHEVWARDKGSTLETRFRYTPSDCFDTFPFPILTDRLTDVGDCYYQHRQSIMLSRREGLTKTYNRFHDPSESTVDVTYLRELHVEMDRAITAAYGWDDLNLGHGFHQTKQGLRFTVSESARVQVLERLLGLNHERYNEEADLGLHDKSTKKVAKNGKKAALSRERLQPAPLFPIDAATAS